MDNPENEDMDNISLESLVRHRKELCSISLVVMVFMNYVVRRTLFAVHSFPSPQVLTISHLATNVLTLWLARHLRLVIFPPLNQRHARFLLPLTLTFCGRIVIFSARVDFHLPVVSLFRQFYAVMTQYVGSYILGAPKITAVQEISVAAMMTGAYISTLAQSWAWFTYLILILDNAFMAANIIYIKEILNSRALGVCGLLYYDSLFRMVPGVGAAWFTNAIKRTAFYKFNYDSYFACHFFMSCVFSFVHSLCVVTSVKHAGALTTVVVEVFTEVVLNYSEWMITNGMEAFHALSLVGAVISASGSLFYMYTTFKRRANYTNDWTNEDV